MAPGGGQSLPSIPFILAYCILVGLRFVFEQMRAHLLDHLDILLIRFRKVPFTCSYPPFRHSAIVVMLVYFFGFSTFVGLTSLLEQWILPHPALILLFIPITVAARYARSCFHQETIAIDKQLIFEEKEPADFEVLDLAHWS
jgi:hypothetical protein